MAEMASVEGAPPAELLGVILVAAVAVLVVTVLETVGVDRVPIGGGGIGGVAAGAGSPSVEELRSTRHAHGRRSGGGSRRFRGIRRRIRSVAALRDEGRIWTGRGADGGGKQITSHESKL